MKIVIIIPTLNEKDNIKLLLKKIFTLKNLDIFIVIVDDSPDMAIKKITEEFDKINYIHRKNKKGRGSAVIYGIKFALKNLNFNYILEMDADLSHNPFEIENKIKLLEKKSFDMIVFSRYKKNSQILNWPLNRKILSYLANFLAKLTLKIPVSDYTNGFRIYTKSAAKHLVKTCGQVGDGFIILSEILVQLYYSGFKIYESDTVFVNRTKGKSSVNIIELYKSLIGLYKIYKLKKKIINY